MKSIADWSINPSASLVKTGAAIYSAVPAGRRLSILFYHQVLEKPDPLRPQVPDAATFAWQMQLVRRGFRVVGLGEAIKKMQQGRLPPRALSITFDDGYRDNFTVALPILQRLGITATFFVSSGFLDGGRMWNDSIIESVRAAAGDSIDLNPLGFDQCSIATAEERRHLIARLIRAWKHLPPAVRQENVDHLAAIVNAPLPDDLMMTSEQVRGLVRAGMDVGGHTVTHPILARLDDDAARAEIVQGRRQLERIVESEVSLFAYPNGVPGQDYDHRHVAMVKAAGFAGAVSTAAGASGSRDDVFQLRRFTPWDRTPLRFACRLGLNLVG